MALSLREQAFVRELPLCGWIAEKAAIAAGYAVQRARITGSQLLKRPEVMAAVLEKCQDLEARADIKADQIVAADLEMALCDIADVADFDGETLTPKAWADLPARYRRTIAQFQQDEQGHWRIRMHSPHPSRERLYKHFGLFLADNKQKIDALAKMMEQIDSQDREKLKNVALAVLGAGNGQR